MLSDALVRRRGSGFGLDLPSTILSVTYDSPAPVRWRVAPPIGGGLTTIDLAVTVNDIGTQEIAIDRGSEGEDMANRWTRIAALTGVIFVVLLVPAVLVTSGSPSSDASAGKGPDIRFGS